MNDQGTTRFLKGLIAENSEKSEKANMNLRVDPDLKYLVDLYCAHSRKNMINVAEEALWIHLARNLDTRLVVDDRLKEALKTWEMIGAPLPAKEEEAPEPEGPRGVASLGAKLLQRED